MSVMTVDGDGLCGGLSEDLLAQVVNKLITDGQFDANSGQTFIIRQEGSEDIQIQTGPSNHNIPGDSMPDFDQLVSDTPQNTMISNPSSLITNTGILDSNQILEGQVFDPNEMLANLDDFNSPHPPAAEMTTEDILRSAQVLDEKGDVIQDGVEILDEVRQIFDNPLPKNTPVRELSIPGIKPIQSRPVSNPPYIPVTTPSTYMPSPASMFPKTSTTTVSYNNYPMKKPVFSSSKPVVSNPVSIKVKTQHEQFLENQMKKGKNILRIATDTSKNEVSGLFRCSNCGLNLISETALKSHRKNCSENMSVKKNSGNSFLCPFCNDGFESKLVLASHLIKCNKCNKTSTSHKYKNVLSNKSEIKSNKEKSRYSNYEIIPPKQPVRFNEPIIHQTKSSHTFRTSSSKLRDYDSDGNDSVLCEDQEPFEEENDFDYETAMKKSQKHLGPLLVGGKYKCRDCERTFSKEQQYRRHISACTNAPLNTAKIDDYSPPPDLMIEKSKVSARKGIAINDSDDELESWRVDSPGINTKEKKSKKLSDKSGRDKSAHLNGVEKKRRPDFLDVVFNKKKDGVIMKCGLCNDECQSKEQLKFHVQTSHCKDIFFAQTILNGRDHNAVHTCPLCSLHYFTKDSLLLHMTVIHRKELQKVYHNTSSQNKNFPCGWCDHISKSKSLLEEHLATSHIDCMVDPSLMSDEEDEKVPINATHEHHQKTKKSCFKCGILFEIEDLHVHEQMCRTIKKAFRCNQPQCENQKFDKLLHLMNHMEKLHDKETKLHELIFDEFGEFMDWLQMEEKKQKFRFHKSYQRMKNNNLCSAWLCQRFCDSSMKKLLGQVDDKSNLDDCQCLARVMVEVSLNKYSGRYDGRTMVKYYPDHKHEKPNTEKKQENGVLGVRKGLKRKYTDIGSPKPTGNGDQSKKIKKETSNNTSVAVTVDSQGFIVFDSDDIAKMLGDKCIESKTEEFEKKKENDPSNSTKAEEITIDDSDDVQPINIKSEEISTNSNNLKNSDISKIVPDNLSEEYSQSTNNNEPIPSKNENSEANEIVKDNDLDVKFSVLPDDAEESESSNQNEAPPKDEATYVLPADEGEWSKMFKLIHIQLNANAYNIEETETAKKLIDMYEKDAFKLSIDKQVDIFELLCKLANVELS